MRTPARIVAPLLALAATLAACAGPGAAGPGSGRLDPPDRSARAIAGRLVLGNEAARAELTARERLARRDADAWSWFGGALVARRALDAAGEVRTLSRAVASAPAEPVALVALRRLSELAETSPARAREVEAALAPLAPRLAGLAAYRARVARVTAAEVLGEHGRAAALRLENGAVTAWAIAGPFGRHAALDFAEAWAPERGELPERVPGPAGLPARQTRPLPAPDGSASLEGEPGDADVFYLVADLAAERGGRYLAAFGTQMSARAWLDGRLLLDRPTWSGHPPTISHVALELAPGAHRLVVKLSRGPRRGGIHVALAREDGAPSDLRATAAGPGPLPPVSAGPAPAPVLGARELARLLEPSAGAVVARVLAARDATHSDRETAKALLAEAVALAPASAAVRAARAGALDGDPTLDESAARARVEADLREALARDAGHAEARIALADLLVAAGRLDDADAVLAVLDAAASRPAALEVRARAAEVRGLSERAEALAGEAGPNATCPALDLALSLAERRRAISREDELVLLRAACRGGRERQAAHLRRRGDPRGAEAVLRPLVLARPWDVEPALARSAALLAAGDTVGALAAVDRLLEIWPRSPRLWTRLGELRELGGDAKGARAARERSLLLDGTDLGLRRALALEDGHEVLDELAESGAAALRAYAAKPRRTDASATMVLDHAAVEFHPGGAATSRTHQIIHVLDPRGVEQFGEVTVPAGADVLVLRTLKADGRRLEPERAGATKGSISLAGLAPGDFLEMEWVQAERDGEAGYAADPFFFRVAGTRIQRSAYAVTAPEGLGLEVDAHNMPSPRVERNGGRDLVRAEATDVAAFVPEPAAAPATEYLPFLQVGFGGGREVLHRRMSEAVVEKSRPTVEVSAFAAAIRAAAGPQATPVALLRLAYARVAAAIQGSGGGLDDASEVLSRGRGGRLALLKAVAGELGFRSRFVLVRSFGGDPAPYRFPSHALFGQVLLRVEAGGETYWLDPAMRQAPFGAVGSAALDAEGLVLAEPGEPLEVVRTPARALVEERREMLVRMALAADGSARLDGTDTYRGALGAGVKSAVERLDRTTRLQAVEGMLARSFPGIELAEATFEGEEDPEAPLVIRWKGRAANSARATSGGLVVDGTPFSARLAARFVQVAARTTPLLVPVPERTRLRLEVTPPPGLVVRPGAPAEEASPHGRFRRTDRVEAGVLVREDDLELERGRVAPDAYGDFARFAAGVDAAQERALVVEPATPGEGAPQLPRS